MRIYATDRIDTFTEEESIFSHRDTSEEFQEKLRIKNALMEVILCTDDINLTNKEKMYWSLHRKGMKNQEISKILDISLIACRSLKCRANKKIEKLGELFIKEIKGSY